jgi:hypothetical protein
MYCLDGCWPNSLGASVCGSHLLEHCCVIYTRSYDIINDIMQTLSFCRYMCGWEYVARTELRDPSLLAPVQVVRARWYDKLERISVRNRRLSD